MNEVPVQPAEKTLLEADDVAMSFRLGKHEVPVLAGVSLQVTRGETVCVEGASGAGKSTLMHILGGLERPSAGRVTYCGRDVYASRETRRAAFRARTIGFVFQSYHLLPELNVLENTLLPALSGWGALGRLPAHRKRAGDLLDVVGLSHRLDHRPMELSGGEQQRVALARALMNEPELILADEPTGNLDTHTGDQVLDHLFALVKEAGHTMVMVTHNREVAQRCERVLQLVDGRLTN